METEKKLSFLVFTSQNTTIPSKNKKKCWLRHLLFRFFFFIIRTY